MYGGQRHISDKAIGYLSDRTLFPATRRINWSELFPKSTELVSLFPPKNPTVLKKKNPTVLLLGKKIL
jgi:hypothetical protein